MPSHKIHRIIDKLLTGREYGWVHELLDVGVKQLGPQHRRLTHNQETCGLIFLLSGGDIGALVSAEAHLLADEEFTRSKRILSKMLGIKKLNKRRKYRK